MARIDDKIECFDDFLAVVDGRMQRHFDRPLDDLDRKQLRDWYGAGLSVDAAFDLLRGE